jgi:hypothetical protein
MHYPAIVSVEGRKTLVSFPDCPGLECLLDPTQNSVTQAQEVLERYLEESLAQGAAPPHPSAEVKAPEHALILHVPISPALAQALESRWLKDLPAHG